MFTVKFGCFDLEEFVANKGNNEKFVLQYCCVAFLIDYDHVEYNKRLKKYLILNIP